MELQISYRIFPKVQKESIFCRETGSNQRNIKDVMSVEGSRDCRRRGMPGSHPFTGKYPAQDERIGIHGVSKREKQLNDIPEVREYEICISEQGILVQRVLCGYGGEEHKSDKRVHREPAKGR